MTKEGAVDPECLFDTEDRGKGFIWHTGIEKSQTPCSLSQPLCRDG